MDNLKNITSLRNALAQQGDFISMKAKIDEALSYFENVEVNKKAVARNVFKRVGQNGAKAAKKDYGSVLKKRSRNLYKSIKSYYYDNQVTQWIEVYPDANSGKKTGKHGGLFRYGWALGAGYTVIANKEHPTKSGKTYLRFKADDKWVTTHCIKVEPKDFVDKPVRKYINSPQCEADMDKEVARQLDYWTKRISKGGKK